MRFAIVGKVESFLSGGYLKVLNLKCKKDILIAQHLSGAS
jgi:hypothetical protein